MTEWLSTVLEYFGCILFVRTESLDPATFKGGNDVKVWIPGSKIIEGHLRGCLLQTFEVLTFMFPGITYPSNVGPQQVMQIRAEQMKTVSQKLLNASHSPYDKGHCITCQFDVCLSPQLDCELCEYKERCVHSSKPESRIVFDTVLSKQLSNKWGNQWVLLLHATTPGGG